LSESELYTDVAFMYVILVGLLFLALVILVPRMVVG
jgi:hypothetical protein